MAGPRLGRLLGGRRIGIDENEYTRRRERLGELLARRGLDALFVPPGSDLEYLTGLERDLPSFGSIAYAHGWVAGAFLVPGQEPLYVLPRMVVDFHLDGGPPRHSWSTRTDDGRRTSPRPRRSLAKRRARVGARTWGETVIELHARSRRRARERHAAHQQAAARQVAARARADDAACHIARRDHGRARRGAAGRDDGRLAEEVEHQCACAARDAVVPDDLFSYGYAESHDCRPRAGSSRSARARR